MQNIDRESKRKLIKLLNQLTQDYKASVVAGEVVENGVPVDSVVFKNLSLFKRFVSREIENVRWDETHNEPDQLVFELHKEGIYDMLPEAVTHNYNVQRKGVSASERFGEYRLQEKNARKFFSPIENEFASRILYLDIFERHFIKQNDNDKNRDFFRYFFGNCNKLSNKQIIILTYLLPLAHKVRSNIELISLAISKILNYPISISKTYKSAMAKVSGLQSARLGYGRLGVDTTMSDRCHIYRYQYDIHVKDVPADHFAYFLDGHKHKNVIDFVQPYFFAANAVVNIILHPAEQDRQLFSSADDRNSFLGFNSYI